MKQIVFVLILPLVISANGQSRIKNGEVAVGVEFSYQALIRNTTGGFCGASIIHKRWILTAAHCDQLFQYGEAKHANVIVGTTERSAGGTTYAVESFYRHEEYYDPSAGNDIALVRVKNDIQFNDVVKPIKLPRGGINKTENIWANVTGWGQSTFNATSGSDLSESLQYALVQVINKTRCNELWANMGLVEDHQICTYNAEPKISTPCKGDSGGPLVYNGTQIGIVSYGDEDCTFERPIVYTRVSKFLTWIKYQLSLFDENL